MEFSANIPSKSIDNPVYTEIFVDLDQGASPRKIFVPMSHTMSLYDPKVFVDHPIQALDAKQHLQLVNLHFSPIKDRTSFRSIYLLASQALIFRTGPPAPRTPSSSPKLPSSTSTDHNAA